MLKPDLKIKHYESSRIEPEEGEVFFAEVPNKSINGEACDVSTCLRENVKRINK